jgi:hypothetical protein
MELTSTLEVPADPQKSRRMRWRLWEEGKGETTVLFRRFTRLNSYTL